MKPAKLQPALLGGLFIGILSALPIVNIANCCCLWVIVGGMLSAYLLQQNHPFPITAGDGVVVGLLAGLIGCLLALAISIPIQLALGPWMHGFTEGMLRNNRDIPPEVRDMIGRRGMLAAGLAAGVVVFLFQVLFAGLGGLLGAVFFKKAGPPPSSEPPVPPTLPGGWPTPPPPVPPTPPESPTTL